MLAQPGVASAARAPQRRPAPLDIESCMEHVERGTCPCVKNCWSLLQHSLKCPSSVMMDMRLQFQETPRNKQSSYIFGMLLPMRRVNEAGAKAFVVDFNILGQRVCGHTWCEFLGLSYKDSRMKKVLRNLRRGDTEWVGDGTRDRRSDPGSRGDWTEAWMRDFVRDTCDWMPDKSQVQIDPNPIEVYHMLYTAKWNNREHHDSDDRAALKFSRFSEIWKEFVKKPFSHKGKTYSIFIRPPRYISFNYDMSSVRGPHARRRGIMLAPSSQFVSRIKFVNVGPASVVKPALDYERHGRMSQHDS